MRKSLSFLLAILLVSLTSCSSVSSSEETHMPDPADAYIEAVTYMFSENSTQTTNLSYLAVDLSLVPDLTDDQKADVLSGLTLENITAFGDSYDALVENGYIVDSVFTNGAFLTITECEMSDSSVTMDLLLVLPDNNRIGYNELRYDYLNEVWEFVGFSTIFVT